MLEEKEAENNLILGLAITINRDIKYYSNLPPLFITIHDQAECVGACLQTPPHNLIIYATKKHLDRSIRELCDYLVDHQIKLPGMIGSKDTVLKFVERWTSMNPFSSGDQINQMVYKLEKVNPIPIADGKLRQATDLDLELIADWMGKFHVEALQSISAKEATELAVKKIREGALYLWETDQPVSMVGWTRPTRNGVTIAYVYTPLQYRKRGYATSSVAKLSELLLAQHRFCALFTDLSNPTSNSIYQKIGYQALDHVLQCKFLKN
ncbi:MAG: acetyltransferase [Thermodesulfobacteriota bacterium]|nr:MAG: acetyltransferase [Thermodesulfobacteriota bacterium]